MSRTRKHRSVSYYRYNGWSHTTLLDIKKPNKYANHDIDLGMLMSIVDTMYALNITPEEAADRIEPIYDVMYSTLTRNHAIRGGAPTSGPKYRRATWDEQLVRKYVYQALEEAIGTPLKDDLENGTGLKTPVSGILSCSAYSIDDREIGSWSNLQIVFDRFNSSGVPTAPANRSRKSGYRLLRKRGDSKAHRKRNAKIMRSITKDQEAYYDETFGESWQ